MAAQKPTTTKKKQQPVNVKPGPQGVGLSTLRLSQKCGGPEATRAAIGQSCKSTRKHNKNESATLTTRDHRREAVVEEPQENFAKLGHRSATARTCLFSKPHETAKQQVTLEALHHEIVPTSSACKLPTQM